MKLFPAIQAHMGRWQYYVIRMSMKELAQNVKFHHEVQETSELSTAIQRQLNTSRATKEIATYLERQEDSFFSSIVIAALGGEPKWIPVEISDPIYSELLSDDTRFSNTFGMLKFDGTEQYYALDGQHRLSAIQSLMEQKANNKQATDHQDISHFKEEDEVSVIIVVPLEAETLEEFQTRFRRLFGNLNRYAKPMSSYDSIVMDEDDAFAIITRRLISEHPFFKTEGSEYESERVKMSKGKNVVMNIKSRNNSHFTSLETLYETNIQLLSNKDREINGWTDRGDANRKPEKHNVFKKFKPTDNEVSLLYEELKCYWDDILDILPILKTKDVPHMRDHNLSTPDSQDCVLFWPVVQKNFLAYLIREMLDENQSDIPDKEILQPLGDLCWNAHCPPWKYIMLEAETTEDKSLKWKIATSSDNKTKLIRRILRWQLKVDDLSQTSVDNLRETWETHMPATLSDPADTTLENLWWEIKEGCIHRRRD